MFHQPTCVVVKEKIGDFREGQWPIKPRQTAVPQILSLIPVISLQKSNRNRYYGLNRLVHHWRSVVQAIYVVLLGHTKAE